MKRERRFIVPAILCLLVLVLALYAAGVRVEDVSAQRELAGADMSEKIGVNFGASVPVRVLDEMGIDRSSYDVFSYIGSSRANGPDVKLVLGEAFY